jgi:hypothetical protein
LRGPAPYTFFCRSAGCKIALGAAPESAAASDLGFARDGVELAAGYVEHKVAVVTAGPRAAQILAHEWVHAEMKAYVPYDSLPTWFNEGAATFVAGEPQCAASNASASFDIAALDSKAKWQAHIRGHDAKQTYCLARDRVAAFIA